MLRKKSLDISFTGLTVAAGAVGGPLVASSKSKFGIVEGGGGWRAMKAGMRTPTRRIIKGKMERR